MAAARRAETLVDRIVRHADSRPHEVAYTFLECGEVPGTSITWRELDRRQRAIAAVLCDAAPAGTPVLLLFAPGLDFVPTYFACLSAGVVPVPAYPPAGDGGDRVGERLAGVIRDAGISIVVSTSPLAERSAAWQQSIPQLQACRWIEVDRIQDDEVRRIVRTTSLALLQYTSGSTAAPRGVMVSHENLLHNLAAAERLGRHDRSSVSVSWLPVNHDMGLIQGVLQAAYTGFPAWLMAPAAFLQRPARWLRVIADTRASHSGAPNFAFDLCVRRIPEDERRSLDLRHWRVAFTGSEPVRADTLRSFADAFAASGFRASALRPAYGLAEATLLVTATGEVKRPTILNAAESPLRRGRLVSGSDVAGRSTLLVACGRPAPGTTVAIVNPDTRKRCAAGRVGEIWVAGPSIARGYWNRGSDSRRTFAAHLADGSGPFLRTGDLGVMHRGQLVLAGRIKDVLIVRGQKHDPSDLERTAERAHPAVRPGGCAAFSCGADDEGVAIAAEVADTTDHGEIFQALIAAIVRGHGVRLGRIVLLTPGALPKTTSGKVQRQACRMALAAGTLPGLASWSDKAAGAEERIA